jgi:hypothetical protein
MNPKIFPVIMMALNICASVSYFAIGDIKHGVYWIAAAVLTFCITF